MTIREERQRELAFEATVDAVMRTRRVLMLISAIIAIGTFHLTHWYVSWELARIHAREGTVDAIKQAHAHSRVATTSFDLDTILLRKYPVEAEQLAASWGSRAVTVPFLGLPVAVTDFSTALMMVSTAVLLWLLFYQRRVEWCLTRLDQTTGWELPKGILEYHFILMGTHTSGPMRWAARSLVWGLPALGVAFLASDCYDLWKIKENAVQHLAFQSSAYVWDVSLRIGLDVLLVVLNLVLGLSCYRAFRRAEEKILNIAYEV